MGAFTALLNFGSFLVFALATISMKRDAMLNTIHEMARQNPDPQAQPILLWFATGPGLAFLTSLVMLFFLALFLIVGIASGALMVGSKNRAPSG